MKSSRTPWVLMLALSAGLSMPSIGLRAQSAPPQAMTRHDNADMAAKVKKALDADPGLADNHIDVALDKGKVLMKGFVGSADDMQKAVRTASKAVGAKNVVNELTIKPHPDSST